MRESLDKLVRLAQISGGINAQCRFGEKWFVQHHHQPQQAVVHIVVSGEGYLKIHGEMQSKRIQAGDVIFFSRAAGHILSHQADCENVQDEPFVYENGIIDLKQSGDGNDLRLFCAHFHYDKHSDLFHNLPEWLFIHLADDVLQPILSLLQQEVAHPDLGTQQVIDSLSKVLLIAIVRAYLHHEPEAVSGVLRGIYDHRLSSVISQILNTPEQDWSVEKMVEESHLSRAHLMRLFKQKIGLSPHHFVLRTRLQKSASLLRQSNESVLSIALSCGFQSETHFIKAFKTLYEVTPSVYRKAG